LAYEPDAFLSLAVELDRGSPASPENTVMTCARRLAGLLEDRLGVPGLGLSQKARWTQARLTPALVDKLRAIGDAQERIAGDPDFRLEDPDRFVALCNETLVALIREASAPTALNTALKMPNPAPFRCQITRGVVQKTRILEDDQGRSTVLLEVDGRIIHLEWKPQAPIQPGDRVAVAGFQRYRALYCRNVSNGTESGLGGMVWKFTAVGGVVALAGLAAIVVALMLGVQHWREGWGLWKYLVLVLAGAAAALAGLLASMMGFVVGLLENAAEKEVKSGASA
jgi:hypothetical protein